MLFLAAFIVFLNSYPNISDIADETIDYRNKIKYQAIESKTDKSETIIEPPNSPTLPNTITPVVSPEKVDEVVNPQPKPKPNPTKDENETEIDTSTKQRDPPLEIKLLTGLINVAPLILVAAVGGFGIYLLFKYKKHFTLRSMFGSAIGLVAICALIFLGYTIFGFYESIYEEDFNYDLITWIVIPVSIVLGGWLSYNIISKRTTTFKRNIGLAIAGAFMGAFLASFLPFWIIFILLIAITLFDIYSVKFGPIKKIMELENSTKTKQKKPQKTMKIYRKVNEKKVKGTTYKKPVKPTKPEEFDLMLMYDSPEWSLGLGDFVIYSMFTSAVLTYFMIYLPYYIFYTPTLGLVLPWIFFLVCGIGILIGFALTIKLLEKRDYLPGLPISVGLGFFVFILCIVVLQITNYLLYSEFAVLI